MVNAEATNRFFEKDSKANTSISLLSFFFKHRNAVGTVTCSILVSLLAFSSLETFSLDLETLRLQCAHVTRKTESFTVVKFSEYLKLS